MLHRCKLDKYWFSYSTVILQKLTLVCRLSRTAIILLSCIAMLSFYLWHSYRSFIIFPNCYWPLNVRPAKQPQTKESTIVCKYTQKRTKSRNKQYPFSQRTNEPCLCYFLLWSSLILKFVAKWLDKYLAFLADKCVLTC